MPKNIKKINFERQSYIVAILQEDLILSNIITSFILTGKLANSHPKYKIRKSIYSDDLVFYPNPNDELTYFTFSRRLGGKNNINLPRLDVSYHLNQESINPIGSIGKIHYGIGTIVQNSELTTQRIAESCPLNDNITFKPVTSQGHTRVYKKSTEKYNTYINTEYELNQNFPHLKQKVLRQDVNEASYLTLRNLGDMTLQDILDAERSGEAILTTNERWQLSIALLKAVIEQVLPTQYAHLDLKPANILIRKTHEGFIVSIADFGLAYKIAEQVDNVVSIGYKAPELLTLQETENHFGDVRYSVKIPKNKASEKIDCYSLGQIISEIFGGPDSLLILNLIYLSNKHHILKDNLYTSNALWHKNPIDFGNKLFTGMHDIPEDIQNEILSIINQMMAFTPEVRMPARKSLIDFTQAYSKWKKVEVDDVDILLNEQELNNIKSKLNNLEMAIDLFQSIEPNELNKIKEYKQLLKSAIKSKQANKLIPINHCVLQAKYHIIALLQKNQKAILKTKISGCNAPKVMHSHISSLRNNKLSPLFNSFVSLFLDDKLIEPNYINKHIVSIIKYLDELSKIEEKLKNIDNDLVQIKNLFERELSYIKNVTSVSFINLEQRTQDITTAFGILEEINTQRCPSQKNKIKTIVQTMDTSAPLTLTKRLSILQNKISSSANSPQNPGTSPFGFLSSHIPDTPPQTIIASDLDSPHLPKM